MKINSLLESQTPSSAVSNTTTSAPEFGRDDEHLEETTAGCVATVASPIGVTQTRGTGALLKGIKTSEKFPNSKSVKETTFNRAGYNPLRDKKDYLDKRDHLQQQLNLPGLSKEDRDYIRQAILNLEFAARKAGLTESKKYKCTCLPNDKDPDCPAHGLEPMEVGDALDVKKGVAEGLVNELSPGLLQRAAQGAKVKRDQAMDPEVHSALGGGYMNPLARHYDTVAKKFGDKAVKAGQRDAVKKIASPAVMRKIGRQGVAEGSLEEYGDTAKGQKMLTKVHKRAVDRTIRADDKNRQEPDYTKRDLATVRKHQATADRAWDRMTDKDLDEGTENLSIGQQMARDGITYSPEKENELIGLMAQYMKKAGMSSKAIRYYLSYDEDFIPDQLSDLPRQDVSEGSMGDELAQMAMKMNPRALVRKDGVTLQEPPKREVPQAEPVDVEKLQQAYNELKEKYKQLGGDSWQYADRMMPRDYEAQQVQQQMNNLARRIANATKDVTEEKKRLDPKCWTGYKKQGTKMKGGVRVNNCVKVDEAEISEEMLAHELYKDLQIFKKGDDKAISKKAKSKDLSDKPKNKEIIKKVEQTNESTDMKINDILNEGKQPGLWANIHAKRERIKHGSGERMRKPGSKGAPSKQDFIDSQKTSKTDEAANPAQAIAMKKKGKKPKNEGQDPSEYDMEGDFVKNQIHTIVRVMTHLEKQIGDGDNLPEWVQMKISQAQSMLVGVMDYMISEKERNHEIETGEEGVHEDWQKVNKKDKTDGMSPKAVKAYRRENPGSKLKTAVTTKPSKLKPGSKDAKRRKSFCARMSGNKGPMKDEKGRPTPKAKALKRWNCEE